ncbi:MAG: tetratricopeptide repeat protein, partial [Myxococcota bacterium]|nr:tetratricopeptide repeat protein [Myxococcota bacterium]
DYAAERVEELDLQQATAARHAQFFGRTGNEIARQYERRANAKSLRRLQLEGANLAAVHRRFRSLDPTLASMAVLAMDPVLGSRGPMDTYIQLLDDIERCTRNLPHTLRAEIHIRRGRVRIVVGRPGPAREDLDAAMELVQGGELIGREGRIRQLLGLLELIEGQPRAATEQLQKARALLREAGMEALLGSTLRLLSEVQVHQGRVDDGEALLLEALEAHETAQDPLRAAHAYTSLGNLYMHQGRNPLAKEALRRASHTYREQGRRRYLAITQGSMGMLYHRAGRLDTAHKLYDHAIRGLRAFGAIREETYYLTFLCALSCTQQSPRDADKALERLRILQPQVRDRVVAVLLALCESHRSALALRLGQLSATQAQERIQAGRNTATQAGAEGAPSWADRNEDVRFVLDLLPSGTEGS